MKSARGARPTVLMAPGRSLNVASEPCSTHMGEYCSTARLLWSGERLLQPRNQRTRRRRVDVLVRQRRIFFRFAGHRGDEEMIQSGQLHDVDRRRMFAPARECLEAIGVRRLDLRIELALQNQNRLAHVGDDLRGVVREQALKLRVVDLPSNVGR